MRVTPLPLDFRPTAAQSRYADALVDLDVLKTRGALARKAGVREGAVELWYTNIDFCSWLSSAVERQLAERMGEVWAAVHKKATSPRDPDAFEAAKLYISRFDGGRRKP